mmetsp:Transcript_11498/g.70713  ORF Transcript_11498/g.70713 Transcript_11498/m.70713 type:complete len:297 (+) Transcript_11498:1787-2677(+)
MRGERTHRTAVDVRLQVQDRRLAIVSCASTGRHGVPHADASVFGTTSGVSTACEESATRAHGFAAVAAECRELQAVAPIVHHHPMVQARSHSTCAVLGEAGARNRRATGVDDAVSTSYVVVAHASVGTGRHHAFFPSKHAGHRIFRVSHRLHGLVARSTQIPKHHRSVFASCDSHGVAHTDEGDGVHRGHVAAQSTHRTCRAHVPHPCLACCAAGCHAISVRAACNAAHASSMSDEALQHLGRDAFPRRPQPHQAVLSTRQDVRTVMAEASAQACTFVRTPLCHRRSVNLGHAWTS